MLSRRLLLLLLDGLAADLDSVMVDDCWISSCGGLGCAGELATRSGLVHQKLLLLYGTYFTQITALDLCSLHLMVHGRLLEGLRNTDGRVLEELELVTLVDLMLLPADILLTCAAARQRRDPIDRRRVSVLMWRLRRLLWWRFLMILG